MKDKSKTKKQLAEELAEMRERLAQLEAAETERTRAAAVLRQDARRLRILREMERAMLMEQSLGAIAQIALDHTKQIVPYQRANVVLFDFETHQAEELAVQTESKTMPAAEVQGMPEALGADGIRALEQGQAVSVNDAGLPVGSRIVRALRAEGVRSCLSVPLIASNMPIGILNVWAAGPGAFASEHIDVIYEVAGDLALAIRQVRLNEQLRRRDKELVALNKATRTMVSSLDLGSVLNIVIAEAKALLNTEVVSVLLRSGDSLIFAAAVGPGSESLVGTQMPITAGIAGWAMRERQAVRVDDAHKDPRFYTAIDQLTGLTTHSVLAVPLIAKGIIGGVIEAVNKAGPSGQSRVFDDADLEILEAMAGPAAIAIENARLYEAKLDQLERLQSSQAKMIQFAKMASLGKLMASIVHDIGGSLHAIENNLTLMQHEVNVTMRWDRLKTCLGLASQDIARVISIVQSLQDFYRATRGGRKPTDAQALLESVLELMNERLQRHNITVKREWADDVSLIEANQDHLKQVFLNLVLNAIEAMALQRKGVLYIHLAMSQMRASAETGDEWQPAVRIEFSDTGEGIPPEIMGRLFEPFVTTKEHGMGLGLSLSSAIIQAHGGQITATSDVGMGSTFTVLLPARKT